MSEDIETKDRRVKAMIPSLCLLSILVIAGLGYGQEVKEWGTIETVEDMIYPRYNHTATLLSTTGEVLVTGGTEDGYGSLSSAEIYDPGTGSWRESGTMECPRMRHTADEIEPGAVMVTGGFIGGDPSAHPSLVRHYSHTGSQSLISTEIYWDGIWSSGPDMIRGRFWHDTAKLPSGDILVIGGLNVTEGALSSCEIFDVSEEEFREAASLNTARARFMTEVMPNGSVLITGGHDGFKKEPMSSCELYLPDEDRWVYISPMNRPRGYHSSCLMSDGRVLVSGGFSSPTTPDWNDSEVYDPDKDE